MEPKVNQSLMSGRREMTETREPKLRVESR